jgi:7-cyano-7-deazaguanine reductase
MIESKSFKLYLNGFNAHRFGSAEDVAKRIVEDIHPVLWGGASGGKPTVELVSPDAFAQQRIGELEGLNLDRLDLDMDAPGPNGPVLSCVDDDSVVEETLRSDLVRALCRVTGQPDWGSIQIRYVGRAIDQEKLLRYLITFRDQQEFHEPLAERIFVDIWRYCQPMKLQVLIRFTRRGGMDINPFRTSFPSPTPAQHRLARQ